MSEDTEPKAPLRVYLAGRFHPYGSHPDWRDHIKAVWEGIGKRLALLGSKRKLSFIDPRIDTIQKAGMATFAHGDRDGVLLSDIVFFFDIGPDHTAEDPGAVNEATIGIEHGKLVIFCTEMSSIHPMFGNYCSGQIAVGLSEGIRWLEFLARYGMSLETFHRTLDRRTRLRLDH